MKYLKKEIFYPAEESEENDKLQDEQAAAYWEYLDKIKPQFPKKLFNAYDRTNYFHDYAIKRVSVNGDAWCYWKRSDVVELEIRFEEMEYLITFNNITYLKLLNEFKDTCWHSGNGNYGSSSLKQGFEEIVKCEIGIVGEGEYSFEFFTSSGAIFEVHFQSGKVEKRKIYY